MQEIQLMFLHQLEDFLGRRVHIFDALVVCLHHLLIPTHLALELPGVPRVKCDTLHFVLWKDVHQVGHVPVMIQDLARADHKPPLLHP